MDYSILVPYVIGTVMGLLIGHGMGLKRGTELTLNMLMDSGFLKFTEQPDGEIVFKKPEN